MRGVATDLRAERRTGVTTCKMQQLFYMCIGSSNGSQHERNHSKEVHHEDEFNTGMQRVC